MTNQEKDLKNAREYITTHPNYDKYADDPLRFYETWDLELFLSKYPEWLEQKGVIQFTSNRHLVDENNGLVKCKHCDRLNCKNNDSCIECGEPDYK